MENDDSNTCQCHLRPRCRARPSCYSCFFVFRLFIALVDTFPVSWLGLEGSGFCWDVMVACECVAKIHFSCHVVPVNSLQHILHASGSGTTLLLSMLMPASSSLCSNTHAGPHFTQHGTNTCNPLLWQRQTSPWLPPNLKRPCSFSELGLRSPPSNPQPWD